MRSGNGKLIGLTLGLLGVLAVSFVLCVVMGRGGVLADLSNDADDIARIILLEIRLPRALLGVIVGLVLGIAGAALQGLLRNPLAEPGLIGASSGAAFGAVTVFYFPAFGAVLGGAGAALGMAQGQAVAIGGMLGAVAALSLLYLLAGRKPNIMTLILAGVAINAFAGAMTSLALNMAPSPFAALEVVFWMMGSLENRSMEHVWFVLPMAVLGGALIASAGRALDAMTLGQDTARSLGFNPVRVTLRVIAGTALAVGAVVSVTGVIGFVGLVVPHLMRPIVGHHPSRLLLPSALAGACLTLLADIAVRIPMHGPELKLGVFTALIGAPFFLYLILKTRRLSS